MSILVANHDDVEAKVECPSDDSLGKGGKVKDYFKSFLPPHVRRRGFRPPPFTAMGRQFLDLVSLPYFPWATMNWAKYPQFLPQDLLAGLTVAIMLVPQGLAYANMAGLPPQYGLYAGTIAGYVYSLFGTSGQVTIGPVILVSLFMAECFHSLNLNMSSKDKYATYVRGQVAPVLSLAVGIQLCVMAFFRIGALMKYVSPSVLTGFVTGSGVYIFISQLKTLFGMKVPRMHYNYEEFDYFFRHVHSHMNRDAMKIGVSAFGALLAYTVLRSMSKPHIARIRQTRPWLANLLQLVLSSTTLIVIVVSTQVSYQFHQEGKKIPIVGIVPEGFNKFQIPLIHNDFGVTFAAIMRHAVPITFLTYIESTSVGRKYALVNKYALDMTQELWAIGLGCVAASFFQAYPPGGSFSRTALKAEIGVKTPFANIITSLCVTIILITATSLLRFVPNATLGAVICTAVISLFDFHDMWRALWVAPVDFVVMMFTFLFTVFIDVEKGLEYGILLSVVVVLVQISKLDMDSIGQLTAEGKSLSEEGGSRFRPLSQYPLARQHGQVKIVRLTANLFFGNVSAFRDEFYRHIRETGEVRAVVVDANGVVDMDLSSLAVMDEMVDQLHKEGVRVFFAAASNRVVKALDSYDLLDEVGGRELMQLSVEDVYYAVLDLLELRDKEAQKAELVGDTRAAKMLRQLSAGKPVDTNSTLLSLARQRSKNLDHQV